MTTIPFNINEIYREPYLYSNREYLIPTICLYFPKWNGQGFENSFGKKPLICLDGKPMFAEQALQHLFLAEGWRSRWISTYAAPRDKPRFLSNWIDKPINEQINQPIQDTGASGLLQRIAERNDGSFYGCWDVFGWNNSDFLFVESKHSKKDSIRDTQLRWLNYGLMEGLSINNFLIVQWDFEEVVS